MKLKLVERSGARLGTVNPKISVSKRGNLYVNSKAMELMKIDDSAMVKLFRDEDDLQAWFIHICKDGYAKLSVKSKAKDGSGQVYLRDIADEILESYYHIGTDSLKFELLPAIEYKEGLYFPLKLIKESLEMEIPNPNGK